jgi:archaetidylinositol phosphate synthase
VTVSGDAARPFESSRSDVPARELAVAWVFGPAANALAGVLAPVRVPPPAVVLANAAAGLLAALAIGLEALAAAALLLQLKTLLDNADGRLARATGRATLFGRYLDTEADLLVNAALFFALGTVTEPWVALVSFLALTLVLSADFNATELYRAAHGLPSSPPTATGSTAERVAAGVYRILFAPHDRLLRGVLNARVERVLRNEHDSAWRAEATRAYHDRATLVVLANLGLSTQLVGAGVCVAADVPEAYLWLVLAQAAALPLLQLRRERLARRALRLRRAA